MVNPGQDGDFTNDPTQNPEHELARKVDSRQAEVEELRSLRSEGGFKALKGRRSTRDYQIRHSNQSLHKDDANYGTKMGHEGGRPRQESSSTAYTHSAECASGINGCAMFARDVEAQKDVLNGKHWNQGNMI